MHPAVQQSKTVSGFSKLMKIFCYFHKTFKIIIKKQKNDSLWKGREKNEWTMCSMKRDIPMAKREWLPRGSVAGARAFKAFPPLYPSTPATSPLPKADHPTDTSRSSLWEAALFNQAKVDALNASASTLTIQKKILSTHLISNIVTGKGVRVCNLPENVCNGGEMEELDSQFIPEENQNISHASKLNWPFLLFLNLSLIGMYNF